MFKREGRPDSDALLQSKRLQEAAVCFSGMWALERKCLSGLCFRTMFLYSTVAQRTQKHTSVNPDVGGNETKNIMNVF